MTQEHPITPPPPHLLKKFSAAAQAEAKKRNGAGYLKTFAILCIEWALNSEPTPNDLQIRSSEITPPPELVHQWMERTEYDEDTWFYESYIAEQAARWGADQELEACCKWMASETPESYINALRSARRPKPPSLKEQALAKLQKLSTSDYPCNYQGDDDWDTIRRALEQLND